MYRWAAELIKQKISRVWKLYTEYTKLPAAMLSQCIPRQFTQSRAVVRDFRILPPWICSDQLSFGEYQKFRWGEAVGGGQGELQKIKKVKKRQMSA
jgi:hypothetical protein